MPSVTRRSRIADRKAVENRVIAATVGLLDSGASFTELSVASIADAAGVARSTFYVHFADKSELLRRIMTEASTDLFAIAGEWFDGHAASGPSEIEPALREFISASRARSQILTAVIEVRAYDSSVAELWDSRIDLLASHIRNRLAEGEVAGVLAPGLDIEHLAAIAAWTTERNVTRQVMTADESDDDAFAASLARALWLMFFGDAPGSV